MLAIVLVCGIPLATMFVLGIIWPLCAIAADADERMGLKQG